MDFLLERFVHAQDGVYDTVLRELAAGEKRSHWMWFIFPQICGLGSSDMARRYALSGLDEAAAYLQHPVLATRLRECIALVNAIEGHSAHDIFGSPDDVKFRSSMTLFARAADHATLDGNEFQLALKNYFGGREDGATAERLP